jgi:hypothetical protein
VGFARFPRRVTRAGQDNIALYQKGKRFFDACEEKLTLSRIPYGKSP